MHIGKYDEKVWMNIINRQGFPVQNPCLFSYSQIPLLLFYPVSIHSAFSYILHTACHLYIRRNDLQYTAQANDRHWCLSCCLYNR